MKRPNKRIEERIQARQARGFCPEAMKTEITLKEGIILEDKRKIPVEKRRMRLQNS